MLLNPGRTSGFAGATTRKACLFACCGRFWVVFCLGGKGLHSPGSAVFAVIPAVQTSSRNGFFVGAEKAQPSITSGSGSAGASSAKTSQPGSVTPAPIRRVIVPVPSQVKPGGASTTPSPGFPKPQPGYLLVPKPSLPLKPVAPKVGQETPPQNQPSPSVVIPRVPKIVVPPTTTFRLLQRLVRRNLPLKLSHRKL